VGTRRGVSNIEKNIFLTQRRGKKEKKEMGALLKRKDHNTKKTKPKEG